MTETACLERPLRWPDAPLRCHAAQRTSPTAILLVYSAIPEASSTTAHILDVSTGRSALQNQTLHYLLLEETPGLGQTLERSKMA